MTIENREAVKPGAKLYARYKGREYEAAVVETKEGQRIELADGRQFKSLSAAGLAVNDGVACNGYAFWSLTKPEGPARKAKAPAKPTTAAKPKAAAKAKAEPKKAKAKKPAQAKGGKKSKPAPKGKAQRMRATDVPSYRCGGCGATFGSQKAAVEHALTHTTA